MKKQGYLILTVFILLFSCLHVAAQYEYFSVSKKVTRVNTFPKIAVDPAKGNFVVTWQQLNENFDVVIYSAFCLNKGGGEIKVKNPVMLSEPDGKNRNSQIAFDPVTKTYMVVWEKYDIDGADRATNIVARRLNNRGRPLGEEFYLLQGFDNSDRSPIISYSGYNGVAPSKYGVYMLLWERAPKDSDKVRTEAGIYAVIMNERGKFESTPMQVFTSPYADNGSARLFVKDPVLMQTGVWVLPFSVLGNDNTRSGHFLEINANTESFKVSKFTDEFLTRTQLVKLSETLFLFNWLNEDENQIVHQRIKLNLKKKLKSFTTNSPHELYALEIVSVSGGGALVFNVDEKTVYTQKINSRGKKQGGLETLTLSRKVEGHLRTFPLKEEGSYLILTNKIENEGVWELIGYVVDVP